MSLIQAVADNNINSVRELLKNKKTDVDQVDIKGNTPLILAAKNGNVDIGILLIKAKADINKSNDEGLTPLMVSIESFQKDFSILLLEQDNINLEAKQVGETALFVAIDVQNTEMVELLLDSGANPNASTANGITPLFTAINFDFIDIATIILKNMATDPNIPGHLGLTPLMLAVQSGKRHMVNLLVNDNRVNLDYPNPTNGQTALWYVKDQPGLQPNRHAYDIADGVIATWSKSKYSENRWANFSH